MFRFALALSALTCLTTPASAQSPLTPISVEIQRYESLIDMDQQTALPCCAPLVLSSHGEVFVHVTARFDVAWSDDLDRISYSNRDIALSAPGLEEPRNPMGMYNQVAQFRTFGPSLSARRHRDWPEVDSDLYMNMVWLVPASATSATLDLPEGFSMPLDLNVPVSQPLSPGHTAWFENVSLRFVERMEVDDRTGGTEYDGLVEAREGQIIRLDFTLRPAMVNRTDGEIGFTLRNEDIALVGSSGVPLPMIGSINFADNLRSNAALHLSWDEGEEPETEEHQVYFLGTGEPGDYMLYFQSDFVAWARMQ